MALTRCTWATTDPLLQEYHDREWGVPEYDDRKLFEHLILDGAQAGLSWLTILKRREHYRRAFDGFAPDRMAAYGAEQVAALLADPGIIRNRLKIQAAIQNARAFLEVQTECGSFAEYLWQFVGGQPRHNAFAGWQEVPARSPESETLSKDLTRRGFRFVGPVICYAFMQAVGMVNDHAVDCFRYEELRRRTG